MKWLVFAVALQACQGSVGGDASSRDASVDASVALDAGSTSTDAGFTIDSGSPVDTSSDLFARLGITFGPKGSSPCQLEPPVIPAFSQPGDADAGVFKVCLDGGCAFESIQAALDVAPAGSTIAVNVGDYDGCVRINQPDITIQGRGGRPVIHGTNCQNAPYGPATIGLNATRAHLQNLEVHALDTDQTLIGNAHGGLDFTFDNLYLHDSGEGLYTESAHDMTFTHVYFSHIGYQPPGGDPYHVGSGLLSRGTGTTRIRNTIGVLAKQNSYLFSIGSETNVLDCVVTADFDTGLSGEMMSFGAGQNTTVTHSLLQKGPLPDQRPFIYWNRAEIRPIQPADQLTFTNNIVISDRPMRDREILELRLAPGVPTTIEHNTFVGPGSDDMANGGSRFASSTIYLSREAAGLSSTLSVLPYPGSLP